MWGVFLFVYICLVVGVFFFCFVFFISTDSSVMLLCFGSHSMEEEEDPVWCDGVVRTVCRFESWLGQQIVTVFCCPEVTLYSWQDVKIQSLMELLPSSLYSQRPRCLVLQMRWEVTVTSSVCACVYKQLCQWHAWGSLLTIVCVRSVLRI